MSGAKALIPGIIILLTSLALGFGQAVDTPGTPHRGEPVPRLPGESAVASRPKSPQPSVSHTEPKSAAESGWNRPAGEPIGSLDKMNVWRSSELNMLAIGLGVGDVTGDGANDVVILDPNTVHLYRFEDFKLAKAAEYTRRIMEFKSVDVAKIRPGGPVRIYVTAQNRASISSFVLEYRNGSLVPVIEDFGYYLRVIRYPTQGPILLGQQKGIGRVYEGPIYRLADQGDQLVVKNRFGVSLKIPIFGFCIGDFDGTREPIVAVYDRQEHIRLYKPSGKRLYISPEFYDGTDVILRRVGPTENPRTALLDEDAEPEYCRPRIMAEDLDHDRVYELLAIKHDSKTGRLLSRTKMLGQGQVVCLKWNGDSLVKIWATPPIQGMITDFAIDSLPGLSGTRLITIERKKTDWLQILRSESQMRVYNVEFVRRQGAQK